MIKLDLLFESKRAWLLPFVLLLGITITIYFKWFEKDWMKTICLMMGTMLLGMTMFFLFIILFRWTTRGRRILLILYTIFTIYCWINGYIGHWYVVIPSFLTMVFFMIWNLGGVENCVKASPYKKKLSDLCEVINLEYDDYSEGVDRYNSRNGLGFFSKVRKKRKVNTAWYNFNSSGLDMFTLEYALFGVSTLGWEKNIEMLYRKISRISEKKDAIYADEIISDEYERISNIKRKNLEIGYVDKKNDIILAELNDKKKSGIKKQKKILRRRI